MLKVLEGLKEHNVTNDNSYCASPEIGYMANLLEMTHQLGCFSSPTLFLRVGRRGRQKR